MAQPELQVLVDWNDDGDFTDSNEDITSDVREINFDHLRDMMTEYMNGSVLDLILNNDGHKYSPPNGSSPLAGNLVPGRNAWVRMWYPYDTFSGAAAFLNAAGYTPKRDGSFSWTAELGSRRFQTNGSGSAVDPAGQTAGAIIMTMEFSDADVTIASLCLRDDNSLGYDMGFVVRWVDSSNYAYVRFDGTNCELRKVIATVDSQVATTAFTWTAGDTKFVEIELHGTSFRVIVDTVEVLDTTLSDAAIDGGTEFGLYQENNTSTATNHEWLDFGGYKSLFYGKLGHIRPKPGKKGLQYCYLKCFDGFESWKEDRLTTVNAGAFPETGEDSFGVILDSLDWPSGDRRLDTGTTLTNDNPEGLKGLPDKALATVYQLQDEEDGFIYIDGDGFARYENRTHRASAPHTTSKQTYKDTYDGTDPGFTDLTWEDGVDNVENHILVKYLRATDGGTVVVWSSDQAADTSIAIPIGANETKNFIVET